MVKKLRDSIARIGNINASVLSILAVILVLGIGCLDYLTGFELSFSLFYLIPISLSAWYLGRTSALMFSGLSAISWFMANLIAGETYSHPAVGLWNTLVRLFIYFIVSILLTYLQESLIRERELSRLDFLTGIANSRAFYAQASAALMQADRYQHAVSVAFIDVDDFKQVNDKFGHSVGDELLILIAQTMKANLRRTDLIARMGGDEFSLLLPEADEIAAQSVMTKIQLALLAAVKQYHWDVSFSIGAVTFITIPKNIDIALKIADDLMYAVKAQGKNSIRFATINADVSDRDTGQLSSPLP